MISPQDIIAIIFDFDKTLMDDSTSQLLDSSVGPNRSWQNRRRYGCAGVGFSHKASYSTSLPQRSSP
jgi:phosphoserine phosphatase